MIVKGDITNLLGCILTHQLPFQTLLACYYVLVDSVLMFQMILYKILFPPRPTSLIPVIGPYPHHSQHPTLTPHPHSTPHSPIPSSPLIISRITPNRDFQRSVLSIAIVLGLISAVAADSPPAASPAEPENEVLGQVFAWICCAFYLTSRLPQIYENHRRKSTQGIHMALFTSALCGNLFYTIGIVTNPLAHDPQERYDFLINALPYLLGSAGYPSPFPLCPFIIVADQTNGRTIVFDVIILSQYLHYYGQEPVELDREAIKRYLTTDATWLSHRWNNLRRQFSELPIAFTISVHRGVYRGYEEVVEGIETAEEGEAASLDEGITRKWDKDMDASRLGRNYGTIT